MILYRRIGRIGYLLGQIPILLVLAWASYATDSWHVDLLEAPATVVVTVVLVLLWSLLLTAWRCHDYNESLWSNFWTEQIPLFGPFLGLWDLVTTAGSRGFNSYGRPPAL